MKRALVILCMLGGVASAQVSPVIVTDQTLTGKGSTSSPLGVRVKTGGGLTTGGGVGGLSLLASCSTGQVLRWSGTAWVCSAFTEASDGTFTIHGELIAHLSALTNGSDVVLTQTAQTANSTAFGSRNTGTASAASADIYASGLNLVSEVTKSSGAHALTDYGATAEANGGSSAEHTVGYWANAHGGTVDNYAFYGFAGDLYDAGAGTFGGALVADATHRVFDIAGAGLTSSANTVSADTTYLQRIVSGTCSSGNAIRVINSDGTVTCQATGTGTVTSVATGTGLTGGTITTTGTINLNLAGASCAAGSFVSAIGSTGTGTCTAAASGISGLTATHMPVASSGTAIADTPLIYNPSSATAQFSIPYSAAATPGTCGGFPCNTVLKVVDSSAYVAGGGGAAFSTVASFVSSTSISGAFAYPVVVGHFEATTTSGSTTTAVEAVAVGGTNHNIAISATLGGSPDADDFALKTFDGNVLLNANSGTTEIGGAATFDSTLDMTSHKILNVTDPTNPQEAATKAYVDAAAFSAGAITGSGTANTTTKWGGSSALTNGWALDDGTTWGVSGKFTITEASGLTRIGAGADAAGAANTTAIVENAGTTCSEVRDATNDVESENCASSSGGFVGTYTNHDFHIQTNATNAIQIDTSQNTTLLANLTVNGGTTHLGAGADSASATGAAAIVTSAGQTAFSVRDSTNDVEAYVSAGTTQVNLGSWTNHAVNINQNGTTTIQIDTSKNVILNGNGGATKLSNHLVTTGTTASSSNLSSCGTTPSIDATSDDTGGLITEGTTASTCTYTFINTYTVAPHCVCTSETSGSVAVLVGCLTTATTLVIKNVSASNNKVAYICVGAVGSN